MDDLFPPFEPDANEPKPRRFKPEPFRMIAPNMITLMALCLGLTAIRLGFEAHYGPAVLLVLVAVVLDGLDGRVARLTNTQSEFGVQYDSLADLVSFGLAPALVMYHWSLSWLKFDDPLLGRVGWAARSRRYSSTPPGTCRRRPSRIAYCWSVMRSSRYRSWEMTMSVPGHESSRSSIAASMSESTSLVGSPSS